mgnify:CR=1 FL=1
MLNYSVAELRYSTKIVEILFRVNTTYVANSYHICLYQTNTKNYKYLFPQKIKFSYPQIYPKIYFRQENHHNRQNNSLSLSYIVLKIPL